MVKILKRIFQKILSIEDTPSHFSKTLVTSVYMIGDSCNGENYIAMALLSILRKVFNRVILEKIWEKIERFTSNGQYGFRPHRGTINEVFIVRQTMKKACEGSVKLHFNFADFKRAFGTIWRKMLWKMMRAIGISNKIVTITEKATCSVTIDRYQTSWFEVTVGVRQGCLLSTTLLNMFLDFVMQELKCLQEKVTFDGDLSIDLKYAEDTTLIAAVIEHLQLPTPQLENACGKLEMKINADKCKNSLKTQNTYQ